MRILADIIKKEVIDSDMKIIGKVMDVKIDKDTFEVTDLVIKKTGISESMKFNGENVVPMDFVRVIGDKIILKSVDDI
ncbi:PRC-barrel domain protein [Methanobrevibacter woesei]|uniref:PRC-barrel domain protein n=1 Tax=Methanobrevibacter woesei TaxID=190976 RepID=A0A2U1S7A5_9EURY|nr:PRC-barrel domain-containing protein [Methanobrevibacter woesei]MCI7291735.1 PRC-barrel domain-containing protein [Methanobrevibacter woesei]PWB85970.1 PRC-barrel domain protein [Methanobrevibacter woesei]